MTSGHLAASDFRDVVESAASDLVRLRQAGEAIFLNLPMLYPDGSFVTVKIEMMEDSIKVSDAGFAYREVEDLDASKSFRRTAEKIADEAGVVVGDRSIFTETNAVQLERAIYDVASTSWRVARVISERVFEEDDFELSDALSARLKFVFGAEKVAEGERVLGHSTTEWPVSALVTIDGRKAVFQVVSEHPNSVYRTSTAFHDIAEAGRDLRLVAFVRSKAALGAKKLALLSPGRVLEEGQADDFFRRAAA